MTTSDQPSAERSAASNARPLPNRKPPHLSWESFAERRIREAEESGAFARIPGLGQPIPGIGEPLDENWWLKKKLRDENLSVLPPTLEARRKIEAVREEIGRLSNERVVREHLEALNETIREAIYSTTIGPADGVQLIDVESEVRSWREARNRLSGQ